MFTPVLRWSAIVMACALVACGDDSGGGGGGACMDGTKSMPGSANDPCPQTGTTCAAQGGKFVACCAGTTWAMAAGKVACQCETTVKTVTCAAGAGNCGNGVIDPGEQCDGAMLGTMNSCMAMGMGMGVLGCDPVMCKYDTSMCTGNGSTGGTGGGGTGG